MNRSFQEECQLFAGCNRYIHGGLQVLCKERDKQRLQWIGNFPDLSVYYQVADKPQKASSSKEPKTRITKNEKKFCIPHEHSPTLHNSMNTPRERLLMGCQSPFWMVLPCPRAARTRAVLWTTLSMLVFWCIAWRICSESANCARKISHTWAPALWWSPCNNWEIKQLSSCQPEQSCQEALCSKTEIERNKQRVK